MKEILKFMPHVEEEQFQHLELLDMAYQFLKLETHLCQNHQLEFGLSKIDMKMTLTSISLSHLRPRLLFSVLELKFQKS